MPESGHSDPYRHLGMGTGQSPQRVCEEWLGPCEVHLNSALQGSCAGWAGLGATNLDGNAKLGRPLSATRPHGSGATFTPRRPKEQGRVGSFSSGGHPRLQGCLLRSHPQQVCAQRQLPTLMDGGD